MSGQDPRQKTLKGSDKRRLRTRGRDLPSLFTVGKGGISEAGSRKVGELLQKRDLVKIKVLPNAPLTAEEAAATLAEAAGAEVVQVLGGSILLYRTGSTESA